VQLMVSKLSDSKLKLDGDLLAYAGRVPHAKKSDTEIAIDRLAPRLGVDEAQIRSDLMLEKEESFVGTATYKKIRHLYESATKKKAPLAIVPEITLESMKITRHMTTAHFARSVDNRYQRCLKAKLPKLMASSER